MMRIRALGSKLDNEKDKIGDNNYEEGDYFILECIEYMKSVIVAHDEGKCESCNKFTKLDFPCKCK